MMYLQQLISTFPIAKYRLLLQPKEKIIFSPFKGATIRGGFGYALKKISCVSKKRICESCILKTKCVYSIIFEARVENKNYKLLGFTEPPRPFVIEPPLDKKTVYFPEEKIYIDVLMFGNTIQFLPYIVLTFIELGRKGLGKTTAKYELLKVTTVDDEILYDSSTEKFYNVDSKIKLSFDDQPKEISKLTIKFLTPVRIKRKGKYTKDIDFQTLIKAIIRRLTGLLLFYFDKKLNQQETKKIIDESQKVEILNSSLIWQDLERYSTRQKTKMKLGGVVGEITYQGDLTKFYPLLKIGEYIHVGKSTTFGLGKYEIINRS